MPAMTAAAGVFVKRGLWVVFAVVIGVTAAIPAKTAKATDPTCLTKAEAREKFPKAHLYWHTQHRCWDATPTGRANRADYKRPRATTLGQAGQTPRAQAVEMPRVNYWVVSPPIASAPAKRLFTPWDERVEGAFVRAGGIADRDD